MEFELIPVVPEECALLYSQPEHDKALGCIGHLRGDFGPKGNGFWSTWWEHQGDLKTADFSAEFDVFVNGLREGGILSNRTRMAELCGRHPEARIAGAWHPDVYGFQTATENYRFFIRCFPHAGDYNFYIYCYLKNGRQQERPEGTPPSSPIKKQHPFERQQER
jgi:hypothetical protein